MFSMTSVVESTLLFFHLLTGNWAFAIASLALLVRVLLLPIQRFNFRQQALIAKIQPELDSLSKLHKDDPLALYKKMSEMKKQGGVKTGTSLLTSLLQIPVFISVYRAFSSMSAIFTGGFWWITSFATPDPFYIFPALVAFGSYLQQRLNPSTAATSKPELVQMMKWMPVLSFIFMVSLPSSLAFYYAVSGLLNVAAEYWIRR